MGHREREAWIMAAILPTRVLVGIAIRSFFVHRHIARPDTKKSQGIGRRSLTP